LYSSREWQDQSGEGPLFEPLQPSEDIAADVKLAELKGFPAGLVETLQNAGYRSLRDILELERTDVTNIEGISTEDSDVLIAFLSEVTEETTPEEEPEESTNVTVVGSNEPAVAQAESAEQPEAEVSTDTEKESVVVPTDSAEKPGAEADSTATT
jgi:hypothetical protein